MRGGARLIPVGEVAMTQTSARVEALPAPGGVAWLELPSSAGDQPPGRLVTGPLGLQILPLVGGATTPFRFKGGRLRGVHCVWSAATVSGAELRRRARLSEAGLDGNIHILIRVDCLSAPGEPFGERVRGVVKVLHPAQEICEQFPAKSNLYTLNVHARMTGLEPVTLAEMIDKSYELTPFQAELVRSAAGLLTPYTEELSTAAGLVGIDRYLGGLAGLVLRTAVLRPRSEPEQMESVRTRTDLIIHEQAADPLLTPASIAAQLNISLRQLYRAFSGTESPAARIRRRRLERAAELLVIREQHAHVEKIAQQCGFVSSEYFSRAFRREFGLSPRAYRTAHRNGVHAT
jgi:AraC-like DNA-binding protein